MDTTEEPSALHLMIIPRQGNVRGHRSRDLVQGVFCPENCGGWRKELGVLETVYLSGINDHRMIGTVLFLANYRSH